MKRVMYVVSVVACLAIASVAKADWSGAVHVTKIATDVYPWQGVVFAVDGGPCPSGSGAWVYYRSGAPVDDNLKTTYATVLAAYLSGKSVSIYVPTGTCNVTMIRPQ